MGVWDGGWGDRGWGFGPLTRIDTIRPSSTELHPPRACNRKGFRFDALEIDWRFLIYPQQEPELSVPRRHENEDESFIPQTCKTKATAGLITKTQRALGTYVVHWASARVCGAGSQKLTQDLGVLERTSLQTWVADCPVEVEGFGVCLDEGIRPCVDGILLEERQLLIYPTD